MPNDVSQAVKNLVGMVWDFYIGCLAKGFTRRQAIKLTQTFMEVTFKSQGGKNNGKLDI